MNNNNKIKDLEKQIKELECNIFTLMKNINGLHEYIKEVEHEVTRVNLKSIHNESRIKIILNNNKVDRLELKK